MKAYLWRQEQGRKQSGCKFLARKGLNIPNKTWKNKVIISLDMLYSYFKKIRRQYFRLVTSEVSVWYEEHSTPNPLGIKPPDSVKIIKGNKFKQVKQPLFHWKVVKIRKKIITTQRSRTWMEAFPLRPLKIFNRRIICEFIKTINSPFPLFSYFTPLPFLWLSQVLGSKTPCRGGSLVKTKLFQCVFST